MYSNMNISWWFNFVKDFNYRKFGSSSRLSRLVAHLRIFRLFMKGKFDAYVLWRLAKKVQNWIVDWSTACNFTVDSRSALDCLTWPKVWQKTCVLKNTSFCCSIWWNWRYAFILATFMHLSNYLPFFHMKALVPNLTPSYRIGHPKICP